MRGASHTAIVLQMYISAGGRGKHYEGHVQHAGLAVDNAFSLGQVLH